MSDVLSHGYIHGLEKDNMIPHLFSHGDSFDKDQAAPPRGNIPGLARCTCFPPQIPHACNLKNQCPSHTCITHFPCPWTCSPFSEELQSDSFETMSHTSSTCVVHHLGNMRDAWECCYSSIVRDVASPSCQLPKHLVLKLTMPFHFICQHPAFCPLMTETRVY